MALSEVSSYICWIQIVFTAIDHNGSLLICPFKVVRIFNITMFWVAIMVVFLAIFLNQDFLGRVVNTNPIFYLTRQIATLSCKFTVV